jgi:glycerol-3-phosphate acyltransferase PlsY
MIAEIITAALGYLLGSIPTAYIATRIATGKDIRKLGGGNVGGLNTFREVGFWPTVVVAVVDLGKGAAAVAIAYWLFEVSTFWVLLAGLTSVIGHNWMLFLKFSGGKGMAPTFGALTVLLPLYGFPQGLLILSGVIIIPYIITRNVALAMGVGLIALPFIIWLGMHSQLGIIMAVVLGLVIGIRFIPTASRALVRAKSIKGFLFDRGRANQ